MTRSLQTARPSWRAFTIVEMLIVVAVITILIALLMPAIQSARESARLGQCRNNVRQMAMASMNFENSQSYFPVSSGRPQNGTYEWTGDPDLGDGLQLITTTDLLNYDNGSSYQPGGWQFNILPYIDHLQLYQIGLGLSGNEKRQANSERVGTIVPTFACASRTPPQIYRDNPFRNATNSGPGWKGFFVRSDFSACLGAGNGMFPVRTRRQSFQMTDGLSNIFLVGHRYINPLEYNRVLGCNDQGWTVGHDWDNLAGTHSNGPEWGSGSTPPARNFNPLRDTPTRHTCGEFPSGAPWTWGYPMGSRFGSPHAVLPMAMADGSVHSLDYSIDLALFEQLGNINDSGVLPMASP